jgi:hypothetical protein
MNLVENNGKHLHGAINSVACGAHSAPAGIPCYTLDNTSGLSEHPFHYGICGKRIRKAGFVGKISPQSMRAKAPAKKTDGERKPFKKKPNSRPQSYGK